RTGCGRRDGGPSPGLELRQTAGRDGSGAGRRDSSWDRSGRCGRLGISGGPLPRVLEALVLRRGLRWPAKLFDAIRESKAAREVIEHAAVCPGESLRMLS